MGAEKAIEILKEYIEKDFIYQNQEKAESDFDKFCIEHCRAIEIVLGNLDIAVDHIEQADREIEILKKRINKAIEYIESRPQVINAGLNNCYYLHKDELLKILKGE